MDAVKVAAAKAIALDVRERKAAICDCQPCIEARNLPAILNILAAHKARITERTSA